MSELLHKLENNEAILLMYIAGELPDVERREVEQMLSVDAGLRVMHEELRVTLAQAMSSVEQLDARRPPSLPREVAARQVGRMVRQWHADKLAAPRLAPAPAPQRRVPWWLVSGAAAAILTVGFLGWWGWINESVPMRGEIANSSPVDSTDAPTDTSTNPGSTAVADGQTSDPTAPPTRADSGDITGFASPALADIEVQANQLQDLTSSQQSAAQQMPSQ